MGFYGRTSAINSNLIAGYQFDKIYASRAEMDNFAQIDGVYIGRNILVEYDNQPNADFCPIEDTSFNFESEEHNNCPWLVIDDQANNKFALYQNNKGAWVEINKEIIYASSTLGSTNNRNYTINENIDKIKYENAYDSTVWVKRESGYLSIASLNTITPEFIVVVDPPLSEEDKYENSIFFDPGSTKLAKILHIPTNWKFDIGTVDLYQEGFDPSKKNETTELPKNQIEIKEISSTNSEIKDTKEINITLESIGRAVSDVYDVIHGENRDNDKASSLQGYLTSLQELPENTIPIKRKENGDIVGAIFNQNDIYNPGYYYYNNSTIWPSAAELFVVSSADIGNNTCILQLNQSSEWEQIIKSQIKIVVPYEYEINNIKYKVVGFEFAKNLHSLKVNNLILPNTIEKIYSNNASIITNLSLGQSKVELSGKWLNVQEHFIIPKNSELNLTDSAFGTLVFNGNINFYSEANSIDLVYLNNVETLDKLINYHMPINKIFIPSSLKEIKTFIYDENIEIKPAIYYDGTLEDFQNAEIKNKEKLQEFEIYYKNSDEFSKMIDAFEDIQKDIETWENPILDKWIQTSIEYSANEGHTPTILVNHIVPNAKVANNYNLGGYNFIIDEAGHITNTTLNKQMIINCGGAKISD